MSNRIFREAHERTLPPKGRDVMWLRPNDGSYTVLVYKPEDGKWISLNRTSWSDLLDVPESFRSEETLRELIKEITSGSASEAIKELMADDVAYRYGGDVDAIKSLPGELTRGEEELPSVATLLSTIIAKVWFEPLAVRVTGDTPDLFIGDEAAARKVSFTVSNFIPGDGAGVSVKASDTLVKASVEGTDAGGDVTIASFTPTARKSYGVTVTAVCADAEGEAGAQRVSATSACAAYWPAWAWMTKDEEGVGSRMESSRKMLKGDIVTSYAKGKWYYHLLVPNAVKSAKQAMDGDWTDKYRLVSTGAVTICGRDYLYYRTPSYVNSEADKDLDLTITLTSIN